QNAEFTFAGTAGQRIGVVASNATLLASSFTIVSANGTQVVSGPLFGNDLFGPYTLPATGGYRMLVNPMGDNVGSVTFTLYDVPPDVTGTLSTDGTPV